MPSSYFHINQYEYIFFWTVSYRKPHTAFKSLLKYKYLGMKGTQNNFGDQSMNLLVMKNRLVWRMRSFASLRGG